MKAPAGDRRMGMIPSAFFAGMLLVLLVGQSSPTPAPAAAQINDARVQRQEMLAELRAVNARLAEIAGVLKEMHAAQIGAPAAKSAVRLGSP